MTREEIMLQFAAALLANPAIEEFSHSYIKEYLGESPDTKYAHNTHYTKFIAKRAAMYADALLEEMNTAK